MCEETFDWSGGGGSATISSPPIKDAVLKDGGHVSWGGFSVHSESEAQFTAYRHSRRPLVHSRRLLCDLCRAANP